MAIRVTGDGHIGLVMTVRPAKISKLETFGHTKHTQEERITNYWTPLMSTQKDEAAVWC